jgi:hypothetical protein
MPLRLLAAVPLLLGVILAAPLAADDAGLEFFEKQVRPILVARCYECHSGSAKRLEGKLRLDSRAAALKGGDTGPAVVPGKPKESLLVDAINYGELYQMPPKSRLPAEEIAALTKWVEMGAPWPQEESSAATAPSNSEFDLAQRKAEHWCWQPLSNPPVPQIRNPQSAIRNPIDAFIQAKLEAKGLSPALPADPRTLLRRVYFDLIGLPPTPEEVEAFLADTNSFDSVVDKLLDSPHFGERWGRHWLDLVRYAESRGHEFDPNIPNAFEYRDYVIRALNADVPYDQFVIEHVAGDLLDKPRLHPTEGWNESIIGTGFWFLGEWLHSPVDIRKDECDRIDNQIDVFTKTFLGLTVACARCHDHKFDAISQADYYALAGYLQSSSYRLTRFEQWQSDRQLVADLAALNSTHRLKIGEAAAKALRSRAGELATRLAGEAEKLAGGELSVLDADTCGCETIVDYANLHREQWMADGGAFGAGPVLAGQMVLAPDGKSFEVATYGAARLHPEFSDIAIAAPSEGDQGRLTGWIRAGRTLKTPTWTLASGQVHYLIEGAGHVYAAVDSHAMINGPLHGELAKETGGHSDLPMRWITHDLSRYPGHRVHLEFSPKDGEDFRVLAVVEGPRPKPPGTRANRLLEPLLAERMEDRAARCREVIDATLDRLSKDSIAGDEHRPDRAVLANWLIGQLPEDQRSELDERVSAWQVEREKLTSRLQSDSRVCLAMWDGTPVEENLLIRGNHKSTGPVVPRRMLEAMQGPEGAKPESGARIHESEGSGRLKLARHLVDPANPFTSRVIVNRIWHHLFGRGIVPSVDNFGVLGQEPTHPELLDHLAMEFIRDGWSIKRLIRRIVLSDAYRQASGRREPPDGAAGELDPQNLLFHRQNLRRLEGEAIRDAILSISGRLDRKQFGSSVPVHLTEFMQGRGRPGTSGPLDGNGRRSIYIAVRRNFLPPMMLAFDAPIPLGTVGRRNVSNVPAQALILMNDQFVIEQSRVWAKRLLADSGASSASRIQRMYLEALAREPTAAESAAALAFIEGQAREYGISPEDAAGDERVWADLGHVLYNVKEFVLLQ